MLGIVLLVVGVVAGVAMWLGAGRRYDDAVAKLAPAPVGCNTTLVFDETGTYTFFVETKGAIGRIDGDCASDARSYDVDGVPPRDADARRRRRRQRRPRPHVGADVRPRRQRGTGVRSVDIDRTGSYVLTATADDTDAVIRVGRDPSAGVAALRVGAVVALIVGVVGGVLLLVVRPRRGGCRRRRRSSRRGRPGCRRGRRSGRRRQPAGAAAVRPAPTVGPTARPASRPAAVVRATAAPARAPAAEPPASAWPPPHAPTAERRPHRLGRGDRESATRRRLRPAATTSSQPAPAADVHRLPSSRRQRRRITVTTRP